MLGITKRCVWFFFRFNTSRDQLLFASCPCSSQHQQPCCSITSGYDGKFSFDFDSQWSTVFLDSVEPSADLSSMPSLGAMLNMPLIDAWRFWVTGGFFFGFFLGSSFFGWMKSGGSWGAFDQTPHLIIDEQHLNPWSMLYRSGLVATPVG